MYQTKTQSLARLLFASFLLCYCQTDGLPSPPNTDDGGQIIDIHGDVGWTLNHEKKQQSVFRTQEQLIGAWVTDGGAKDFLPRATPRRPEHGVADTRPVDFSKEMVIAVFKGKATDHERIKIERIFERRGNLVVEYRESPLYKGTTPMLAFPCDVVVVRKWEGEVEFKALPRPNRLPVSIP